MAKKTRRSLDSSQFTVRPLSREEGDGYLVEYPDTPGCMSDGDTIKEATANGREALRDCVAVFQESGRKVPKPVVEAAVTSTFAAHALFKAHSAGRERGSEY